MTDQQHGTVDQLAALADSWRMIATIHHEKIERTKAERDLAFEERDRLRAKLDYTEALLEKWQSGFRAAVANLAARAEKAEAEALYLEADYDERGYKLWRLAAKAGHEPSESDNDADAELSIATALAERDRALAALQKIRDLHQRHECTGYPKCVAIFGGECAYEGYCDECRSTNWPCPTVAILDDKEQS